MRFLLACMLALAGSAAVAADLPVRKSVAPAPLVANWQGLYFGIHGGMNLGSFNPIFGTGSEATTVNLEDNSAIVGGHMGFYVQSGSFVFGPEIGIQWMGFESKATIGEDGPLLQQTIDWLAYGGANVGILFGENLLVGVGGGVAWANHKGEVIDIAALDTTAGLTGWYVGARAEYRLGPRVRLGLEYKHFEFGDVVPAVGIPSRSMTMDQLTGRLSFTLN